MSGNAKLPTARAWREQQQGEAQEILARLPEIAASQFTLNLGSGNHRQRPGRAPPLDHPPRDHLIYRERARSEDYHRFELLARLLRQKYGSRVRDLVPADRPDVAYYLYGDFLGAVRRVEAARKTNFGDR